jgi:UDP-N-acetylmuramoyl-tripeptide--D-alanyl-D-alanine ligase
MTLLTLADVIEALTGRRIFAPQPLSRVVIDSRQATPGTLFVALPGQNQDGHDFVAHAFQQGAIVALTHRPVETGQAITINLVEESIPNVENSPVCLQTSDTLAGLQQLAAFWRQKFNPRVIGITGSVGKSTTKELVWAVLSTRDQTLKSESNYNNEIGLPLTLLNLQDSHRWVVLEMGMYALGEIELLCRLARPQVGVITNVGPVHLERLGTIERIAQAKSELVQALPPANSAGVAILNYDDPLVRPMAQLTAARICTYGLTPEADLWASDVAGAGLEGIRLVLHYQGESIHLKAPLLGRHSVHTVLRAALVGLVEGLDWSDIVTGLQTLPSSAQLRLVAVPGPNGATILDDTYNASPASTIAALNLLDDLTGARKIAVLGDMLELGSYEEEGHRKVGCRAAAVAHQLIVIGPRARFIAQEAQICGLDPASIIEMPYNQAAITYLAQTLGPQDVVLVKGSHAQRLDEIVSALTVKHETLER